MHSASTKTLPNDDLLFIMPKDYVLKNKSSPKPPEGPDEILASRMLDEFAATRIAMDTVGAATSAMY